MKKLLLTILLPLFVTACGGGGGGGDTGGGTGGNAAPTLSSIAISPATVNLTVGGSQQLTITATYSDSSTADVTSDIDWAAIASTLASFSNGLITSTSSGSETITISSGSVSADLTLSITGNVTSDLFGKWVYIDTTEEIELLSTTTLPAYTQLSTNILKIGTRHLLRASVANTAINGNVLADLTKSLNKNGQKAFSGIGGIDVILSNVNDPSITTTATTVSDGSFTDSSLPSGIYTVTGDNGTGGTFSTSVRIAGEKTDLGNFTFESVGYNFKTELILDQEFAYSNGSTYTGVIRMHNIGSMDGVGLAYDVTMTDTYLNTFTPTITLGTVTAGTYKDIPISFKFNPLKTAKRTVTINTDIRDVYGNVWNDSFDITIYRRSMPINLAADASTVKGYVVIAGNKFIPFDTSNSTINVPVDPETPMYVLLANADVATETTYSIGIDTPSVSTVGFNDPIAFEPNNNETAATTLALGAAEVAYLHVGDLDYFVIDQSAEQATLNSNLDQSIANTDLNATYRSTAFSGAQFLYEGETIDVAAANGNLVVNDVVQGVQTATIGFNDTFAVERNSATNYQSQVSASLSFGVYAQQYLLTAKPFTKSVAAYSVSNADINKEYLIDISTVLDANDSVNLCVASGSLVIDSVDTSSLCQNVTGANSIEVKENSLTNYAATLTNTVSLGGTSFDFTITNKTFNKNTSGFAQAGLNLSSNYQTDISSVLDAGDAVNLCVTNGTLVVDAVDTAASCQDVTGSNAVEVKMQTAANYNTSVINTVSLGGTSFDVPMTTRLFTYNTTTLNTTGLDPNAANLVDVSSYIQAGESTEVCTSVGTIFVNSSDSGQACQTVTGTDLVEVNVTSSVNYNDQLTVTITVGGNAFDVSYQTRVADITATPSIITMVANDTAASTMNSESANTTYSTSSSSSFVNVSTNVVTFTPLYADIGSYVETIDSTVNSVTQGSTDISLDVVSSLLDATTVTSGGTLSMKLAVPTTTDSVTGIRVGDVDVIDGALLWDEGLAQVSVVNNDNKSLQYNNKLYVLNAGGFSTSTLDVYDPVTDQWSSITMPFYLGYGGSFVEVGGKLYVLGGKSNTVYEIDPVSYTVSTYAGVFTYYWQSSQAVVINGKIYLVGGTAYTSASDSGASGAETDVEVFDPVTKTAYVPTNQQAGSPAFSTEYVFAVGTNIYLIDNLSLSVYKYDTVADSMTAVAPRPGANIYNAQLQVVNGKAYLFGGSSSCYSCSPKVLSNAVYEYNTATNIWTAKASMLTAREGDQSVVINNKIYTFGVQTDGDPGRIFAYANSKAEVYDPVANTWTSLTPTPTPVHFAEIEIINGVLYLFGGEDVLWTGSYYGDQANKGVISMQRYLENDTATWLSNGLYQIDFTNIDATTKALGYTRGGVVTETYDITVQ